MAAKHPSGDRGGLSGNLGVLLASGEGADVTLEVGGSRLHAHRAILAARSPLLRARLRDLAPEGALHITDVQEPVLRQLLHFMYTDQVPSLSAYAAKLLVAADKYGLPLLKELCEDELVRGIHLDNASEMAVLALKCSCTKLKVASIDFIKYHQEVLATSGWENAMVKHPRVVAKICRLMVVKPYGKEESTPPEEESRRGHPEGEEVEAAAAPPESGAAVDVYPAAGVTQVRPTASGTAGGPVLRSHRRTARTGCYDIWLRKRPRILRAALAAGPPRSPLAPAHPLLHVRGAAPAAASPTCKEESTPPEEESTRGHPEGEEVEAAAALPVGGAAVDVYPAAGVTPVRPTASGIAGGAVLRSPRHAARIVCSDEWLRESEKLLGAALAAGPRRSPLAPAHPLLHVRGAAPAAASPTCAVQTGRYNMRLRKSRPSPVVPVLRAAPAAAQPRRSPLRPVPRAAPTAASPTCKLAQWELNRKLLEAAKDGEVEEVRRLVTMAADITTRDGYKMTALHWAAEKGHMEVVKYLISIGSDVNAKDRWLRTPVHRAAARRQQCVVNVLREAGADWKVVDIMGNLPGMLLNSCSTSGMY